VYVELFPPSVLDCALRGLKLREVPTADLPLALGQLVLTVIEQPGVRRVHVRAERCRSCTSTPPDGG
jgi:hypothetical protein